MGESGWCKHFPLGILGLVESAPSGSVVELDLTRSAFVGPTGNHLLYVQLLCPFFSCICMKADGSTSPFVFDRALDL